jgi:hypothetical protein
MIVLDPVFRIDIEYVATPPVSVTVASLVVPFINVTVPVGVPAAELTIALNVTVWPKADGFWNVWSISTGGALFTTSFSAAELLLLKPASPL